VTRRLVAVLVLLSVSAVGCSDTSSDDTNSTTTALSATTTTAGAPSLSVPTDTDSSVPASATVNVEIVGFAFTPAEITIATGSTVVWTNADNSAHTVTETTAIFDSGALQRDQSFRFTFNTPGIYSYRCTFHSGMRGTITVR
jgi:plastocyanin